MPDARFTMYTGDAAILAGQHSDMLLTRCFDTMITDKRALSALRLS